MKVLRDLESKKKEAENKIVDRGQRFIDLTLEPKPFNVAISIADTALCGFGELGCIVALPGSGKTNISESIAASFIAAKTGAIGIDTIGFKASAGAGQKVLWIDTERTDDDILESKNRLCRRLGKNIESFMQYIDIVSFIEVFTPKNCVETLIGLIETGDYGLVLIDGLLEFTTLNNEETAANSIIAIRAAISKAKIAAISTIHPNKGTETIAGHAGAYIYRYSRFCLFLRQLGDGQREITSDFPQGKLSKSNNKVSYFYSWCNDSKMMVSTEQQQVDKSTELQRIAKDGDMLKNLALTVFKEGIIKGAESLAVETSKHLSKVYSRQSLKPVFDLWVEKNIVTEVKEKSPAGPLVSVYSLLCK